MKNKIENKEEYNEKSLKLYEDEQKDLLILEDYIRKTYLSDVSKLRVVEYNQDLPLNEDIIDNVRLYHVSEMVYKKGESATDKFATVFNTLSTYNSIVFVIIDSDGCKTDFYVGVRNNEGDENKKRSTVTLGDTLKNSLIGQFPGVKLDDRNRKQIEEISAKIEKSKTFTSVSVLGSEKIKNNKSEEFVQGLEKFGIAMAGRSYTGIIIAECQSEKSIQAYRRSFQNIYSSISSLQKIQTSENISYSTAHKQKISEFSDEEKVAYIAEKALQVAGPIAGAAVGAKIGAVVGAVAGNGVLPGAGALPGAAAGMAAGIGIAADVGGKMVVPLKEIIEDFVPRQQITEGTSNGTSYTIENKIVTDLMKLIDDNIARIDECESYGMWNVAAYFASDDMSSVEIAASNYRSLMSGDGSGKVMSAINSWGQKSDKDNIKNLGLFLSRFNHPQFCAGVNEGCYVPIDATTTITGKELGLHLGLPRNTISGFPVIEHAEFGKEVVVDSIKNNDDGEPLKPEDYIVLGKVRDLGKETNRTVLLTNEELTGHTFVAGSTGSGKTNIVCHMLSELHQDGIKFLIIEPAKGEYKNKIGGLCKVYGTNPRLSEILKLNPFSFPENISVLEHIDRLIEILNACWPMYAAMPAVLKDAIERAYVKNGWDLENGDSGVFPTFFDVISSLSEVINESSYSDNTKGDYIGALVTRVKSMTNGLNGKILCSNSETSIQNLFNENVLVDLSRVSSSETKALIMGVLVMKLQEYRINQENVGFNQKLNHVTVLEEAHNLLRKTSFNSSADSANLQGKSVEMITNSIAEMRTYGEGFIIVDQAPGLLDEAVIRNTNTKIILRLPDYTDRELVGKAGALSDSQIEEIAKLPTGVAVVYQNEWVEAVLCQFPYFKNIISTDLRNYNEVISENYADMFFSSMFPTEINKQLSKENVVGICKWIDSLNYSDFTKVLMKNSIKDELHDLETLGVVLYNLDGKNVANILMNEYGNDLGVEKVKQYIITKYNISNNCNITSLVNCLLKRVFFEDKSGTIEQRYSYVIGGEL